MKSGFLSRRHRNPRQQPEQEKEAPFFSKSNESSEQPFFETGPNDGANSVGVQTKLTIGQPGDKYEQEADAVAEHVVSGQNQTPVVQRQEISTLQRATLATPQEDEKLSTAENRMEKDKLIQEKPAPEPEEKTEEEPIQQKSQPDKEEEKPVQTKPELAEEEPVAQKKDAPQEEKEALQMAKEEEEPLQKKNESGGNATASAQLSSQIQHTSGKGNPLPDCTRTEMENAFGTDFSGVNIHTNTDAVQMNKELGAQAFTHGQDVYFNSGKYKPENADGKRLLAHELTHVVQQGGGVARSIQRSCPQFKQKKVIRDNCMEGNAKDPKIFIEKLEVDLKSQTVKAIWSNGKKDTWPCSPNPKLTPKGADTIGVKCGIMHTNYKKDAMAYFTAFRSTGYRIGFHNSQRVGTGIYSHGCVRVSCSVAKIINENTWSRKTKILVK